MFVVGDSLTVGTEPWLSGYLQSSGWRLAGTDARVGRGVAEGLAVLQAHSSNLPDTVLIALGTNDYNATPNAVATWLRDARAIVGSRRLVWVNLCLDDRADPRLGGFRRVNAALATFAASDGVDVADWCSFASARGVNPGPDGIHYASGGYRIRAAFYAASLTGQA